MGFKVSKDSIRKHLISEGFKSLALVETYELTNEKKKELNGAKIIKILTEIMLYFTEETIFRCGKKKKEEEWKVEAKIHHLLESIQ